MDIFKALKEDHEVQRTLIDQLCKTEGSSDGRQELFERVKVLVSHHAVSEERHFYIPLMKDDLTQEKARHSVAEHHEMDEMMEELTETDMSSPHWLAVAKKLQDQLHHHLDEEEDEVFPLADKVLSQNQKTTLASRYRELMNEQQNAG